MCGIFGYVGDIPADRREEFGGFLTRLAENTAERGRHATGFAAYVPETYGKIIWAKAPLSAERFVKVSAWKTLLNDLPPSFVGHTRYSTGSSPGKNANNHPFIGNRYAVVHNGTVRNASAIRNQYALRMNSETDSEVILRLFERFERSETAVRVMLKTIEGAAAVVAIDRLDGSLIVFRNAKKPLVSVWVPRWNATVYASTADILRRALADSSTRRADQDRLLHFHDDDGGAMAFIEYEEPDEIEGWRLEAIDNVEPFDTDTFHRLGGVLGARSAA